MLVRDLDRDVVGVVVHIRVDENIRNNNEREVQQRRLHPEPEWGHRLTSLRYSANWLFDNQSPQTGVFCFQGRIMFTL
jgi:hypothetical protein